MKKFLLAAVAASLVSVPAVAAPQRYDRQDQHRGWDNHQSNYRSWHRGDRFNRQYARNYRELDYRHHHGLRRPPHGYHWVQSGDDALLVGVTTGVIASIIANAAR